MTNWVVEEDYDDDDEFLTVIYRDSEGHLVHYPKRLGTSGVYNNEDEDHEWLPYNWTFE